MNPYMKNIYTIIFVAMLCAATPNRIFAQWITVYHDLNAQFYDAAFPTDLIGYVAASDSGGRVVLCTNDGGVTWSRKPIPGWSNIDKIAMTDSVTGYLIKGGAPGKILKTTDGFNTYSLHTTDSSFIVQAISLLNDSTGFYLNNAARLRKFKNNGSTVSHVIDTLADGQNLQFVTSYTGYMDTGNGLLMSADAGSTWNSVNNNLGFYCVEFNFADSMTGYFTDYSKIYKTTDGGQTFSVQNNFPNVYSLAVNGNFCMAANDTGNVSYTTDGGLSWQGEITGINFVVAEPYTVKNAPGGSCYLFSQFCGEVKKWQPVTENISQPSANSNFTVYPEPCTSQATISFCEPQRNAEINLLSIEGKEIFSLNFSGTQFPFDMSKVSPGIYFLSVRDEMRNIMNRKIIKQ